MLKLIRIRKRHVPNTLAVAAALLLVASSLAGVDRPSNPAEAPVSLANAEVAVVAPPETGPQALAESPRKQSHTFRVRLFLFRH